ncbi:MAG TPA: VOC family protein [Gaiellaceae bacterium]|nr:VOC family protein [Gaiellaceae bacterium]
MKIEALDHVALWTHDRDTLAQFVCEHLGMHEIERTDAFTLVGADARRGKLTLFVAEGERRPGLLRRIAFAVPDLARALARLPRGQAVERVGSREAHFRGPGGLGLGLVERAEVGEYDIDHVAFAVSDAAAARTELLGFGFELNGARLAAGAAFVDLLEGRVEETEPLFNHLGLRVRSAEEHIAEARNRGLEIADVVDAPNTYALFVYGPERIKLEYVEHKASFALT